MLQHFTAGQTAVALVLGQLIHLVQLLQQTLLVGRGQPVKAGVAAEGPLLILSGLAAMLVEPVAEVTGWRGGGTRVPRPGLRAIG